MIRAGLVLVLTLFLASCVTAPVIVSKFNPAEAEFINKSGTGIISGQAFLRRNDGIVVYAAGSEVILIPRTAYATERIGAIYRGGKLNNFMPEPEQTDPLYRQMTRRARANGEGRFEFSGLADGDYYVVTDVVWNIGGARQGGSLMENASVRAGQPVQLIMTGQ